MVAGGCGDGIIGREKVGSLDGGGGGGGRALVAVMKVLMLVAAVAEM
jgi:hypothetical protein